MGREGEIGITAGGAKWEVCVTVGKVTEGDKSGGERLTGSKEETSGATIPVAESYELAISFAGKWGFIKHNMPGKVNFLRKEVKAAVSFVGVAKEYAGFGPEI